MSLSEGLSEEILRTFGQNDFKHRKQTHCTANKRCIALYSAGLWNTISKDEQRAIKEGLEELDNGMFKSHKEVMKKYLK